jgi:hypothetical protein
MVFDHEGSRMKRIGKPSPALVISLLALFVALGGAGMAATGGNFILGQSNTAGSKTSLSSGIPNPSLDLYNTNTTAPSTPLRLNAATSRPPMIVNSKVRVDNLNADSLDGVDSGGFLKKKLPLTLTGSVPGDGVVHATNNDGSGMGIRGSAPNGGIGVYGEGSNWSGYFAGHVFMSGNLSCSGCVTAGDLAADGGWHYIGDPGEPGFENGWVNYDAAASHADAVFQHAAYYKDKNGYVHLGGLIKSGNFGTAFSLAGIGLCPYFYRVFPVQSNNSIGRVTVTYATPSCGINVDGGSNAWVSLDGISYRTWSAGDGNKPDLDGAGRAGTPPALP